MSARKEGTVQQKKGADRKGRKQGTKKWERERGGECE